MKATPYRQAGMSVQQIFRRVHLASIDINSENSILLKDTVTHSRHCILKEICGALRVVREKLGLVFRL